MSQDIKQFKLTNDDEIICEVLQWDDSENLDMIIRGAMRIIAVEDYERGVRFYAFRPWMGFNDDPEVLHALNAAHIISSITPSGEAIDHYSQTLKKLKGALAKKNMPLDDISKNAEEMDDAEFDAFLARYIKDREGGSDSAEPSKKVTNVIKFKPKGTVH